MWAVPAASALAACRRQTWTMKRQNVVVGVAYVGREIGDHVLAEAGGVDATTGGGRIDRREHKMIGAAATGEPVVSAPPISVSVPPLPERVSFPGPPVMVFARPLPLPVKAVAPV